MLARRRYGVAVFVLLLSLGGCVDRSKIRPHTALGSSVEALRAQFNRDVGRVRMLMVVAPT